MMVCAKSQKDIRGNAEVVLSFDGDAIIQKFCTMEDADLCVARMKRVMRELLE